MFQCLSFFEVGCGLQGRNKRSQFLKTMIKSIIVSACVGTSIMKLFLLILVSTHRSRASKIALWLSAAKARRMTAKVGMSLQG